MIFKTFLPRSLFGRSLLIMVTPVLLIQIVATFIFFDRHWEKVTSRLAYAVGGEIAVIADYIEKGADSDRLDQMRLYASRSLDFLISYKEGEEWVANTQAAKGARHSIVTKTLVRELAQHVHRPFYVDVDIAEKWVQVAVALEEGVLYVTLPQRRLFSSSGYVFLLWMIGTSLLMLAIAILFMRNQIRPIRRLAIIAERTGRGQDIPASFRPEGAREVRQAAQAFLDMHDRIRRQVQQRTAMLSGISHDLRTPLTRMKLQAAMLENTPDVAALKSDIADMERMLNAYLDFVRGEGGEAAVRTDLDALLNRLAANVRRQGAHVDLEIESDLSLQLRPVAFERMLGNLISNARKYGDHIILRAHREQKTVLIMVDDNGPGIPESAYDDVFKPFVRGEPSRNPSTGGVGLGLAIAQDIVHGHGGRIWLEKSPLGGLRVVVEMPL